MHWSDYTQHDAVGLAELIRRGEVSATEAVKAALARMDEVNARMNAVIFRHDGEALEMAATASADGQPFTGVPFLLKNLGGMVAGKPLTMGCRALSGYIAPHDSELTARYRRAGLIFLGTTNTPEFGLLAVTEPELHGATRNPWNLAYSPGGSSGGAAAAVAAGIIPAAHGGDGGGSIRIPASACGVFGLKPSRGRMPLGPNMSDGWNGLVVPHVITRSVRDSAVLLDATHGPDIGAPYVAPAPSGLYQDEVARSPQKLRVAFTTRSLLGQDTHADCIAACRDGAKLLSDLGHEVEEKDVPISPEEVRMAYLTVICACTAAAVRDVAHLTGQRPQSKSFEAPTWFLRQVGEALSAADYEQARATIGQVSREMGRFFATYDVLMTPTMAYPPVQIGELALKPAERLGLAALRAGAPKFVLRRALEEVSAGMFERTANTMLFNMTGQPAMSVPLWWNSHELPIGVQFAARFGDEATLFRLAAQLEQCRPWALRRPTL